MSKCGSAILDIHCFKNSYNNFIIKEAVAIDVDSGCLLFHHIVKPPYAQRVLPKDKRREANWLTNNFHGLKWQDGDLPFNDIYDKIKNCFSSATTVFVKGEEKKEFIRTLVPSHCTVVDLQLLGCPSIKVLNNMLGNDTLRCRYHITLSHR